MPSSSRDRGMNGPRTEGYVGRVKEKSEPMKTLLLCLGLGLAAIPAQAAAETMFSRMDTNKDQKVSLTEYLALFDSHFKRLDKNRDQQLTPAEFGNEAFRHADANKDGLMTAAEHKALRERQFRNLDKNEDGFLTPDEYAK